MIWPAGFERIPDEDWAHQPIEGLARKYDSVEHHGWYHNLDPTVDDLRAYVEDGYRIMDYSGGTGILAQRLLPALGEARLGILIADSSPKFLRLALEKLCDEPRVAFRLIRFLKKERRLQLVEEFIPPALYDQGLDGIVSTNAIHLYYDLDETLRSWARVLRPDRRVFVQSGNIGNTELRAGEWIIDATVEAIHREALRLVRRDDRFRAYREGVKDRARMEAYDRLRRKYFLPVKPLEHYLESFRRANLDVIDVRHVPIEASVDEWYQFLAVYHEGVLGWVGGAEKIEAARPSEQAVQDRLNLIREAMRQVFKDRTTFPAVWTYLTAEV